MRNLEQGPGGFAADVVQHAPARGWGGSPGRSAREMLEHQDLELGGRQPRRRSSASCSPWVRKLEEVSPRSRSNRDSGSSPSPNPSQLVARRGRRARRSPACRRARDRPPPGPSGSSRRRMRRLPLRALSAGLRAFPNVRVTSPRPRWAISASERGSDTRVSPPGRSPAGSFTASPRKDPAHCGLREPRRRRRGPVGGREEGGSSAGCGRWRSARPRSRGGPGGAPRSAVGHRGRPARDQLKGVPSPVPSCWRRGGAGVVGSRATAPGTARGSARLVTRSPSNATMAPMPRGGRSLLAPTRRREGRCPGPRAGPFEDAGEDASDCSSARPTARCRRHRRPQTGAVQDFRHGRPAGAQNGAVRRAACLRTGAGPVLRLPEIRSALGRALGGGSRGTEGEREGGGCQQGLHCPSGVGRPPPISGGGGCLQRLHAG